MVTHITIETIYLAAFESHRGGESAVYALILTPTPPDDYRMYDAAKIRLPLAKKAAYNDGSTRALRWALNYINPSTSTVLRYSLPFDPDEIDLSFYPRLELEAVSRQDNPAFYQLTRAAGAIRAA